MSKFILQLADQEVQPLQGATFLQPSPDGTILSAAWSACKPAPLVQEGEGRVVFILGNPICGELIARESVACTVLQQGFTATWLQSLNGEFSIILVDTRTGALQAVSSRFVSPPFFYYHATDLTLVSMFYGDLWQELARHDRLQINRQSFYEYLLCKRVFGVKTHDTVSKVAEPSTLYHFTPQGVSSESYWQPDFRTKTTTSLKACAVRLRDAICSAIERKCSDGVVPGLFLSGGMDTRLIAACFGYLGLKPRCYTVNDFKNREVRVAEQICEVLGFKHRFIPFTADHYRTHFPKAAMISACMGLGMPMFLGYEQQIDAEVDCLFHGHAFDYFFQGMYIPRKTYSLLGRQLFLCSIGELPPELPEYFLGNIPYRIKGADVHDFLRPQIEQGLRSHLHDEIQELVHTAETFCTGANDQLEWISFHNLFRHYSFVDHWTIHENREQRTISFDNDIYQIYQEMPVEYRFDRRLMRACLKLVSPKLSRLMSANTTYPVGCSRWGNTAYQLRDLALRALKLSRRFDNNDFERMGLPLYYAFEKQLAPYVEEAMEAGRLEALELLNMDKIRAALPGWLADKKTNNQLLYALISMDQFLKLDQG